MPCPRNDVGERAVDIPRKFTLDQTGTHWYHTHNGEQRSDGLLGALIVVSSMTFEKE